MTIRAFLLQSVNSLRSPQAPKHVLPKNWAQRLCKRITRPTLCGSILWNIFRRCQANIAAASSVVHPPNTQTTFHAVAAYSRHGNRWHREIRQRSAFACRGCLPTLYPPAVSAACRPALLPGLVYPCALPPEKLMGLFPLKLSRKSTRDPTALHKNESCGDWYTPRG